VNRRAGILSYNPAMVTRSAARPAPKESTAATQRQLDRVLASATFQQVDRLKRFLQFIVSEHLEGRGDELKEYVVGVQVFGKEPSFDPRTDPIVRVQARRLRARLDRYYHSEGQQDHVIIELPKGGYAPVIRQRDVPMETRRSLSVAVASRNTIAVLSIADHSAEGTLHFFCEALRQELTHGLTRFRSLRVVAAEGQDAGGSLRDVGLRLDAALLVNGSVRPSGANLRIAVQIIDTASGSYSWSEVLDVPADEARSAPEKIAQTVLDKVRPELLESGGRRGAAHSTQNLAAHNLYLQGRYHLNQRTEEGLQKAVEFFERAIVEDERYALAHSGLSDAYALLTHYGVLAPTDVWTKAASSAAAAVMLDSHAAEAHTSFAHMKATQDWDFVASEQEFNRAISLDPRYPTARHWYAMSCLVPMGRLDIAAEQMAIAQSLDPVSSIIARDVAVIHLYRGDLDAALDQCDHTIELNPHFSPAYLTLGMVQEQLADYDEAAAAMQRAVHLSPDTPRMHAGLARALARSGKRQDAQRILRRLEEQARKRYIAPIEFASVYLALDDVETGLKWLSKAVSHRCFEILSFSVDPRFALLRKDPRFARLVRQVGLGTPSPTPEQDRRQHAVR
jgi:TolB-like protein/Flp pilus assembly protein TadD